MGCRPGENVLGPPGAAPHMCLWVCWPLGRGLHFQAELPHSPYPPPLRPAPAALLQNCCHPHLEEEGTDYGDPTEKESNAGVTTAVKESVFI